MLNQIPQLSIILTSRKQLGIVPNCVAPKIQFLSRLKAEKDVELFLFHADAGKISSKDIYNFILADPNYDINKVFPKIKSLEQPVPKEVEDQMTRILDSSYKNRVKALANQTSLSQSLSNRVVASDTASTMINQNKMAISLMVSIVL